MKMFGFFWGVTRNQNDSIRVTARERFPEIKKKRPTEMFAEAARRPPGG